MQEQYSSGSRWIYMQWETKKKKKKKCIYPCWFHCCVGSATIYFIGNGVENIIITVTLPRYPYFSPSYFFPHCSSSASSLLENSFHPLYIVCTDSTQWGERKKERRPEDGPAMLLAGTTEARRHVFFIQPITKRIPFHWQETYKKKQPKKNFFE